MPEIRISQGDACAALSILQEAAAWLVQSGKPMWQPASLTREHLKNPDEEFLVLWVGDEAAATLTLSFHDPFFWPDLPPGASGYVHKLAVRRKFAGQGLPEKLISHSAELCRRRGVFALRLDTDADRPALHALYEGMGFQCVETKHLMPPGHNEFFDLRLYKLDLAVFQTERLYARKMTLDDLPALSLILRDEKAMVAYEHAFSEEETLHWLKTQLQRYQKDGVGLWAIVLKESGEMIGQCGLTMQPVEGETLLEVGYLFQRAFWHRGYAIEAASAAKRYAFEVLKAPEVCSIIRENNLASINVAIRNGMLAKKHFIHHYWGVDMPHIVFSVKNPAP